MSLKYEVIGEKILYFPSAFGLSKSLIALLEDEVSISIGDWIPWLSHGDNDPWQYGTMKHLTSSLVDLEIDIDIKNKVSSIISEMYFSFDQCYKEYFLHLGLSEEETSGHLNAHKKDRPSHIAIKKYFVGESLGPHPDWEDEGPTYFTASMYFNDDYEGGELFFPVQQVSVKPLPGSVVLFPSKYLHESTKVTVGSKYVTNILGAIPEEVLNNQL